MASNNHYLQIAEQAARAGGRVLMEYFGGQLKIEHKGEVDLVTEADRAAEEEVVRLIRSHCPDHDILAEEGDYGGHGERGSNARWIIDPLDGTTNFAHGFPWFAVSVALEVASELVAGVVYNPHFNELFSALKGSGAFLNGEPIRVSATDQLDQSLLATGFPYDRKTSAVNNFDHFVAMQQAARACRRPGAASLDLACVAAGRFDGFWEMKLKPWDVAAGALLVTEAGGRLTDFDGDEFNVEGVECLASNGLIHAEMISILRAGRRPEKVK